MAGNSNAGRKSKLTPELQEEIINRVKMGATYKYATIAAGIDESTFYSWINKGERDKHKDSKYAEFLKCLKKAKAELFCAHTANITKQALGRFDKDGHLIVAPNWVASMTYLERQHSDEFGRKDFHEHSGQVDGQTKVIIRIIEDDK